MTPGRYEGMPAAEYHAAEGLGSTSVRAIAEYSVAHYLANDREETAAMRRGSLHHAVILEPDRFRRDYVAAPERTPCPRCPSGRLSVQGGVHCHQHGGREESAEWVASIAGATLISAGEYSDLQSLAAGVRESVARSDYPTLLTDGAYEVSYFARAVVSDDGYRVTTEEEEEGIPVKARVDIVIGSGELLLDLKGVADPSMLRAGRRWAWRIVDHVLHIQAAMYSDIVEAVTGERPAWGWLVHQAGPPYATRLYTVDDDVIDVGRERVGEALRRWKAYTETGDQWCGWPTGRTTVEPSL